MTELYFAEALTPDGWAEKVLVTINGGRIVSVASNSDPGDAERHAIGIPGLSSLHSHAFQRGMAGLAEHRGAEVDSFWTWRDTMYRFALALSPDEVRAIAAMLHCELLESGFTSVGEFHYLHHAPDGRDYDDPAEMAAAIVEAADESGIGMTLLPVYYRFGGFSEEPARSEQRRFIGTPDRFARLVEATRRHLAGRDRLALGLAPHSLRAAGLEDIGLVAAMAPGRPVHIHVAEQTAEVEDCLIAMGARPVERLLDGVDVDGRWCLIHATHMTRREHERVAASGAVVGLCPVTEANLGDGIFNLPSQLSAGGRFGVGTDSNVSIGAAEELRQLEYSQRLARHVRNVACPPDGSNGRHLVDHALAGGAAAMGRGSAGLVVGAFADIVALDADDPFLCGRSGDRILDAWIFGAGSGAVATTWSGGRKVVEGGRHVARDSITARYRRTIRDVLSRF